MSSGGETEKPDHLKNKNDRYCLFKAIVGHFVSINSCNFCRRSIKNAEISS